MVKPPKLLILTEEMTTQRQLCYSYICLKFMRSWLLGTKGEKFIIRLTKELTNTNTMKQYHDTRDSVQTRL